MKLATAQVHVNTSGAWVDVVDTSLLPDNLKDILEKAVLSGEREIEMDWDEVHSILSAAVDLKFPQTIDGAITIFGT